MALCALFVFLGKFMCSLFQSYFTFQANLVPRFVRLATVIISLAFAGCSSNYSSSGGMSAADAYQESRYSIKQDKAPDTVLDGHQVKDVIPKSEPRSAGGNKSPYTVRGQTYKIIDRPSGWNATGVASWYGAKFHGHKTSNGEIFDMYQVSAAHKTLPIPTYIRVTNLDNGRSVIARVNDRGPFHGGRIVDLSYAGAVKLGYENLGTARVKIEVLKPSSSKINTIDTQGVQIEGKVYYLQVGAFGDKERANELAEDVRALTRNPVFVHAGTLNRVRVGPLTHKNALKLQKKLSKRNIGPPIIIQ